MILQICRVLWLWTVDDCQNGCLTKTIPGNILKELKNTYEIVWIQKLVTLQYDFANNWGQISSFILRSNVAVVATQQIFRIHFKNFRRVPSQKLFRVLKKYLLHKNWKKQWCRMFDLNIVANFVLNCWTLVIKKVTNFIITVSIDPSG